MITYGSVCSGIEAASVAWEGLGWKAAWFAEIEKFPAAVLAHHYPSVPNLGDMTKIAAGVRAGSIPAPAVMVGGTPCQAFSIAGLRKSLDDPRGQLTLAYVDLANAIDEKELQTANYQPSTCGKTCREVSAPKTTRLDTSLPVWLEKMKHSNQVHNLNQAKTDPAGAGKKAPVSTWQSGQSLVVLLDDSANSPGDCLMPNTSEWPNAAAVCSLSQVLETTLIPQKYFLSSTACAGILRRAENRQRKLPELLLHALQQVAGLETSNLTAV